MNIITKFNYYIRWFFKCKILKKKIPLTSSIIITDKCNLKCKHCSVAHLGYKPMSFREVTSDINDLYNTGSRVLVITGGEPFMWKDKDYNLEDVIIFAKELGFFRIVVCTNGTFKLESCADYLWVSLDGFPEEHKAIRGNIYTKVVKNILSSNHKGIYINFTISKINYNDFDKSAIKILTYKNIRGILFHIFTPYIGADTTLLLSMGEKINVLNMLYKLKKKHPYKISNTFDGLKAMRYDTWKRPVWGSITINQGEKSICCCRKDIYDKEVCNQCGCTPAVETWVLQQVKPLTIIENLKFL